MIRKRKTRLIATMLLFALCGYAQKGEKGIGGNFSIPVFGDAGLHFKLEYMKNMTDRYRIIPYVSMNDDPCLYIGLDNHFFLTDLPSVYRPYINIGVGIPLTEDQYNSSDALYSAYATLGVGVDYKANENWTYQAEMNFNMHSMLLDRLYESMFMYLSVGITYTFPEREKRNTNEYTPIYIPYNIGTNVGTGVGAGAGSVSTGTSTTIQTEKRCHLCAGTGICTTCNGRGQMINSYTGQYQDCPNCHAPLEGKCHSCGGTGRK